MTKKIFACIVLILVLLSQMFPFVYAAPELQDVYDAYGLEKGDDDIAEKIYENPPELIALKPIEVRWYEIVMPLDAETLILEKGKTTNFSISVKGAKDQIAVSIQSDLAIGYLTDDDPRILLTIDQNTHLKSFSNGQGERDETSTKRSVAGGFGGHEEKILRIGLFLAKDSGAGNVGEIYFSVEGVKVKGGGVGIFKTNTEASSSSGESGVSVSSAVVIGLAGAAAAAAGAAGAAGMQNKNSEGERQSSYKMKIYKDFGDKIKYDGPPVFVYARMVEINHQGEELERPDLTEKIEILSTESFLEIGENVIGGSYMSASVTASANGREMPATGIISFRFTGEGGSFQNDVQFKMVGEAYLSLEDSNLYVLAGSGSSFKLSYELVDFLAEPKISIKAMTSEVPFDLELGKEKDGSSVIVAVDRGAKKPFESFFENFRCEITAENEKEYARTVFNVVLCYEGLLPDFLGKPKEIKGYKREDGEMEETLIAFKLGIWNESNGTLDFIKPLELSIDCSDKEGTFKVIGIEFEEDTEYISDEAAYYIFKANLSLPAKEPIKGKLTAEGEYNGVRYESETEIEMIPDLLKYWKDYEKEYENCQYIMKTYLPARFHEKKLEELEEARRKLDIEDLKLFRERVWNIASRAILQDKEKYMQDSYWWDEAIAATELVVAVGDIAFDVVLSSIGGPLAGFAAGQIKGAFLDFVSLYVEKPSIGMPELQEFLEKRLIQMVGQADGAFNMPEPGETKKLAAWLTCYTVYRIIYHWWYDKDDQNKPIGIGESIRRGIYDLAGKGATTLLSGYIKESSFKTGKVADFAKADQNLYDEAVSKMAETLSDFIDRIKNGGIQFN